jgi:hypothetical protein
MPNYDSNIHTVRVPIFKSTTLWSVAPTVGLEMDLTRAVVREIEAKTPFKVVGPNEPADTELLGTVVSFNKVILSYSQINEVRESETTLVVELVWKDLRTGELLSKAPRRAGQPLPPEPGLISALQLPSSGSPIPNANVTIPATPTLPTTEGTLGAPAPITEAVPLQQAPLPPLPPSPPGVPPPGVVTVRSVAHFRPELGESVTTAMQKCVDRMAIQIISMMEKPW